jgi:putative transposase
MDDYQRSDGAVYLLGLHGIWCPKYRKPLLVGPVAVRMKEILDEVASEHGWQIEAVEVMPDHVHVFVLVGPRDSAAIVARAFKGRTSRLLRAEFKHLRSRLPTMWSRSYFVSSVGRVSAATVKRYIEQQTMRPTVGRP